MNSFLFTFFFTHPFHSRWFLSLQINCMFSFFVSLTTRIPTHAGRLFPWPPQNRIILLSDKKRTASIAVAVVYKCFDEMRVFLYAELSKKTGEKERGNGNRRLVNVDPCSGWWSRSIHSQNFWDTQFSYVMTHDIRLHCNILYRVPLIYLFIGFFLRLGRIYRRGGPEWEQYFFSFRRINTNRRFIRKRTHIIPYNKSSGIDCVNILLFRPRWRRSQSFPHNKIEGDRGNCNIARRIWWFLASRIHHYWNELYIC